MMWSDVWHVVRWVVRAAVWTVGVLFTAAVLFTVAVLWFGGVA